MRRSNLVAGLAVSVLAVGCGGSALAAPPPLVANGSRDLVVIGDFGVGGTAERRLGAAVRRYVRTRGAGLLLTVGDNDYSTGRYFSGNWASSFGWTQEEGVRVAGTLGNHDVLVGGGRYERDELAMSRAYYRRSFGSIDLFVLDSNHPRDRSQRAWLERALAESSARWKVGVFHHAAYSCGLHRDQPWMRPLVDLMRARGVRLVLTGHDHNYQRFELDGLTEIVAGWGAAGLYAVGRCLKGTPAPAASRDDVHGFLALRVSAQRLEGEAITLAGKSVDSFQVTR
jgi:Calcineurin-like phosphoesterase